MSKSRHLIHGALAVAAVLSSGLAQARDTSVQWSVSIGVPIGGLAIGVPLYAQPYPVQRPDYPVYAQPYPVYPSHRVVPRHYQQPARWDLDGDGIPNRYDPVYNPRWDRDGDGIPNRYDRHPLRQDRDAAPHGRDRYDGPPQRQGRDTAPYGQDRNDGRPGRSR